MISNYLAQKENDHLFGKATWTPPSTLYLCLLTATPSASDTGSTITETGYTSYARLAITSSDMNSASNLIIDNSTDLVWEVCTGGTSGTITYIGVCDAASAGNFLMAAAVDSSFSVTTNEAPKVTTGNLDFQRS